MNGEYIKQKRISLSLTQEELAQELGVSLRTIQNYEYGGIIPKSKHAFLREFFASKLTDTTNLKDVIQNPQGITETDDVSRLIRVVETLSETERANSTNVAVLSQNVADLIEQGKQQTENITKLINLLCQKGVDAEPLLDKEKGGLKHTGGSKGGTVSDADNANAI